MFIGEDSSIDAVSFYEFCCIDPIQTGTHPLARRGLILERGYMGFQGRAGTIVSRWKSVIIKMSSAYAVAYRGKGVRPVILVLSFGNRFPKSSTFL